MEEWGTIITTITTIAILPSPTNKRWAIRALGGGVRALGLGGLEF